MDKRFQRNALSDVQCTDAFGAVEFVSLEREQIYVPCNDIDRHFSRSLHRVRVEQSAMLVGQGREFFYRQQRRQHCGRKAPATNEYPERAALFLLSAPPARCPDERGPESKDN